jgi:hypothetical protein
MTDQTDDGRVALVVEKLWSTINSLPEDYGVSDRHIVYAVVEMLIEILAMTEVSEDDLDDLLEVVRECVRETMRASQS